MFPTENLVTYLISALISVIIIYAIIYFAVKNAIVNSIKNGSNLIGAKEDSYADLGSDFKRCPHCKKSVIASAQICNHCGENLN